MDAVRSRSPKTHACLEHPREEENVNSRRGRTKEKGKYTDSPGTLVAQAHQSKERSAFSKLGDVLKFEHDETEVGDGWMEFKKGKALSRTFYPS